jgi:5-methylcytosine-specific restriction endonuclease McrA
MSVLVLNSAYQPINVTSFIKGFRLVYNGKAEILEEYSDPIITERFNYPRPSVIRLLNYTPFKYRKSFLNRRNIFVRDGSECVYCGTKNNLTIDHVLPSSRGGKNTWQNMITCCKKCNAKKDNRTPEEANMIMKHKPFEPSYSFLISQNNTYDKSWANYLK